MPRRVSCSSATPLLRSAFPVQDDQATLDDILREEGAVGVAEVVIATGAAACLGADKVGGVAVKA